MTEQQIDWIEKIYTDIMPINEKPSYDRLYNDFNLSAGQAQYISRVLTDKKLAHWRNAAINDLKSELESKVGDANELIDGNEGSEPITITIDSIAATELKRIVDMLWKNDRQLLIPRIRGIYAGIKHIDIPAQTLVVVLDYLNRS